MDWGEDPAYSPPNGSKHIRSFMVGIFEIYKKCLKTKTARAKKEDDEIREYDKNDESDENGENGENCKYNVNNEDNEDSEDEEYDISKNDVKNDQTNKVDDSDRFKDFAEFACFDEEDKFFLDAVSKFIWLKFKKSFNYHEITQKSNDAFHYIFIMPSSWNKRIIRWILRPLFINSGIITKADHKDRILFLTDLEAVFYHLQSQKYAEMNNSSQVFRKGQESVLCRVASNKNTASIEFDLISPQYPRLDVSKVIFFPRVLKSEKASLSLDHFKKKVGEFIKEKFIKGETEECEKEILDRIVDSVLNYFSQRKVII
ncbi:MAG: hypothetical protein JSY10_20910 [Paenibacillus sp.]|nr:hypothetical protein [Paenibacillus sp.]